MVELPLIHALLSGKPYFGPALMADMDTEHEDVLSLVVEHVLQITPTPRVLEVGSWLGGMTVQLAALLKNAKGWSLTCLEDFHPPLECATTHPKGEDSMVSFFEGATTTDVLPRLFRHNIARIPNDHIIHKDAPLLGSLKALEAESFDLILLHGTRALTQFEEVLAECQRVCADGGNLCGTGLVLQKTQAEAAGLEHAYAYRHGCFRMHDLATGVWYFPEVTRGVDNAYGALEASNGFWAVNHSPASESTSLSLPRRREVDAPENASLHYSILPHRDGYLVLHNSVAPSLLHGERLGEREIPEVLEFAATSKEAREKAERLSERLSRRKGIVLETTAHYYVCKYGASTYLAQAKMNDFPRNFRIFVDRVGDYEMAPVLLTAPSATELKRKVAIHEATLDSRTQAHPIVERFNGYYLYAPHEDHSVAVQLEIENGRPFWDYIGQADLEPYVLTATNLDALKARIEKMNGARQKSTSGKTEPDTWL